MTGSNSIRRFCVAGSLFLGSLGLAGPIECIAPGKAEAVSLTMNDAEIRYALPRGVTSFIIHLDAPGQRRCFTLVNEGMAAAGELSIATSNERLAANNPRWSAVDGPVRFKRKRLFALSLIGVEAKFVKLTFQVDDLEKITRHAESDEPANRFTAQAP